MRGALRRIGLPTLLYAVFLAPPPAGWALAHHGHADIEAACTSAPHGSTAVLRVLRDGERLSIHSKGDPGTLISCDAAGYEPLDLVIGDTGETTGPLQPARRIELGLPSELQDLARLRVEWREPRPGGSRLLAARTLPPEMLSHVYVAREQRWIRLLAEGFSPTTLRASGASEEPRFAVPLPKAGGELLITLTALGFTPHTLELVDQAGLHESAALDRSSWLSMTGVAPGRYHLRAAYRGGVERSLEPVEIRAGETTELSPLPLPTVGGADVALSQELCLELEESHWFRLLPVTDLSEDRSKDVPLVSRPAACAWTVEGLGVGPHVVQLVDEQLELVTDAFFDVRADDYSRVFLDPDLAFVRGRVSTQAGDPLAIGLVEFSTSLKRVRLEVRADGEFEGWLAGPGSYHVSVKTHPHLPGYVTTRKIEKGINELDLVIPGGAIVVEIESDAAELEEPVQIRVLDDASRPRVWGFVEPDEAGEEIWLFGIEFGTYRVTGASGKYAVLDPPTVEISESRPTAEAILRLTRSEFTLRVVDEAGQPIPGSRAQVGPQLHYETSPGVFELEGASSGVQFVVIPPDGFAPTCGVIGGSPQITTVLPAGEHTQQLLLRGDMRGEGLLRGHWTPRCLINLAHVAAKIEPIEDGRILTLANLPEGPLQLFLLPGAHWHSLEVPAPPLDLREANP